MMPTAEAFRGSLLTRHFVSHVLTTEFAGRLGESTAAAVRRRCVRRMLEAYERLGPASSVRAIFEVGAAPLFAQLGYTSRLRRIDSPANDRRAHAHAHARAQAHAHADADAEGAAEADAVTHASTQTSPDLLIASLEGSHRVTLALIVSPWHKRLDRVWRLALQTGLNGQQRWCLCFNGHQLRVIDVDRPYARRFLEFDLRQLIDDERAFDLLWALLRPAALAASARTPALLDQIVAACDAHGGSVREALQHGVRRALTSLATALARAAKRDAAKHTASKRSASTHGANVSTRSTNRSTRSTSLSTRDTVPTAEAASGDDIVSQALTMIYRLLFLLFAEARALVPIWHPVYRDSYSIGALHALASTATATAATEPHAAPARGLWPAVQAISRLAHDGCSIDDLSVTAFNGQLFSPDHTPLGEHLHIASPVIADVLDALMTTPARARRGRERITYADLGVEQLGTVYERVLDYAPHLERDISEQRHHKRHKTAATDASITAASDATAAAIGPAAARAPGTAASPQALRRPAQSSARRKESGSFYTPRSMADYLVRVTLGPLVADASADDILELRVLDPSMGSGAFLVSACRFLAHAHDHARERDGGGGLPSATTASAAGSALSSAATANAEVRRHIARHCLFGVDLNPMAVQLARLSLWLTTMTRDAPLTFLDHHLRVGDSLVGASLEDLLRRPAPIRGGGRGDLPLFCGDEHTAAMRAILPARAALTANDDSAATVREKERLLHSLAREGALARWLQLADAWCAAWFAPATGSATRSVAASADASADASAAAASASAASAAAATAASASAASEMPSGAWPAVSDYVLHGHAAFPLATLDAWLASARRTAGRRRFFHWTLEFPEMFFDDQGQPLAGGGGFDAIVGNPPWDMIRNDALDDEGNGARMEREAAALSRFVRQSGLYRSAGDAHFNCYQLFVDRTLALLKRGGRFGLVLPWGIAADHGSARLRRRLLESCDLDTLVVFENNRGIFPIHRSTRFALMSGTTGHPTRAVRCRFGERDPAILDTLNSHATASAPTSASASSAASTSATSASEAPRRRQGGGLVMTVDLLRRVSGEGLAFPDARTAMDLALLERLHTAHPALASSDGWHVKFGRELNVSEDRALFVELAHTEALATRASEASTAGEATSAAARKSMMLVIDGKHLRPFAIALDRVTHAVRVEEVPGLLARLPDISRARLAFRDIASPTNKLTLIAAMLPAGVVSTHTISCLKSSLAVDAQWCLCALLNSFVANYLMRMRVSTHVTLALIERMPVPKPGRDSFIFGELAALAGQLARNGGSNGGSADSGGSGEAYARLQAIAAHAYGLTRDELGYVLTKFPLIEDETKRATLAAFGRPIE
jgi:hypothetical protein